MAEMPRDSQSLAGSESEFARNEGGCARLFMILVAVFSPMLGICISIVYRIIGYRTMANRLLWISVVMLLVWGIVVVWRDAVWSRRHDIVGRLVYGVSRRKLFEIELFISGNLFRKRR